MSDFGAYFAPRYMIKIEGTELAADITNFISSVSFTEQENSASKIALTVINKDFTFSESKIFAEGNKIDLWMGYVARPMKFMARGIIVKPNQVFPSGGMPMINVVAHDLSRKLMSNREDDKGKTYSKKKDSEIAALLFKTIEARPDVRETTGVKTRTRKQGITPWQFLKKLAKINGYVITVKYDPIKKTNVGYFGPPKDDSQVNVYKFIYGTGEPDATLFDFRTDMSLASQESKLQMTYTDEKTRKTKNLTIEISKKKAEETLYTAAGGKKKLKNTIPNGPSITFGIFGQQMKTLTGRTFKGVNDAKRFAAAWFQSMQDEFILGNGTVLGVADIRRGHVHELSGLGNRLDGEWHFTSVTHRMHSGSIYEVHFTARKVVLDNTLGTPAGVAKVLIQEASI